MLQINNVKVPLADYWEVGAEEWKENRVGAENHGAAENRVGAENRVAAGEDQGEKFITQGMYFHQLEEDSEIKWFQLLPT